MAFRILVADEHEVVRRGLKALLEAQPGWEIVGEVASGKDLIEKAAGLMPDLVILDTSLHDADGLEACRRIRKANPHIEVIVLTHEDSPFVVRKALEAGIRGYVLKSDAGRDLLAAVETVRQHKPFLSPSIPKTLMETGDSRCEPDRGHCR